MDARLEGRRVEVLKAKWTVRISGSVPASIEFTIDPATMSAEAQSGVLKSFTPAPLRLEQLSVEQDEAGFGGLVNNQIDADVKLNMSVQSGGDRLILSIPDNDSITLDESQLMQFVIPAWDGGAEPGKLNVVYAIELGQNVTLNTLLTESTKFSEVYYLQSLA